MVTKWDWIYLLTVVCWVLAPWSTLAAPNAAASPAFESLGLPALIGPRLEPLPADAGDWKADPFAGPMARHPAAEVREVPKPSPQGLRLSGILTGVRGRYALLNEQVVMAGDELDGVRILKIERDRILVEDAAGRRVLPVFPE